MMRKHSVIGLLSRKESSNVKEVPRMPQSHSHLLVVVCMATQQVKQGHAPCIPRSILWTSAVKTYGILQDGILIITLTRLHRWRQTHRCAVSNHMKRRDLDLLSASRHFAQNDLGTQYPSCMTLCHSLPFCALQRQNFFLVMCQSRGLVQSMQRSIFI